MLELNKLYNMDCMEALHLISDASVNCCVTSPPYWNLRDYGVNGQIGLEESPDEYVSKLVNIFREVRRILKDDGTLWLNLGDTYAGSNAGKGDNKTQNKGNEHSKIIKSCVTPIGAKRKDLIGIPWMVAFALRADGWYLRQDIIWSKPNPMPESVKDRCTKSHEYIFLFSKSARYYFDAKSISEPVAESTKRRLSQDLQHQKGSDRVPGKTNGAMKAVTPRYGGNKYTSNPDEFYRTKSGNAYEYQDKRNKRDVWTVSTKPFKEAHFATFPSELIEPCILAGSPDGGIVFDPFFGSGTVGVVAKENNRFFIGAELNKKYCEIAQRRIDNTLQQLSLNVV